MVRGGSSPLGRNGKGSPSSATLAGPMIGGGGLRRGDRIARECETVRTPDVRRGSGGAALMIGPSTTGASRVRRWIFKPTHALWTPVRSSMADGGESVALRRRLALPVV